MKSSPPATTDASLPSSRLSVTGPRAAMASRSRRPPGSERRLPESRGHPPQKHAGDVRDAVDAERFRGAERCGDESELAVGADAHPVSDAHLGLKAGLAAQVIAKLEVRSVRERPLSGTPAAKNSGPGWLAKLSAQYLLRAHAAV